MDTRAPNESERSNETAAWGNIPPSVGYTSKETAEKLIKVAGAGRIDEVSADCHVVQALHDAVLRRGQAG